MVIELPIKTVAGLNAREHHMARARRVRQERGLTKLLMAQIVRQIPLPAIITLTRVSAGTLDDDAPPGALKAIRDGIADAYGIDDADPRIKFQYAQQKCPRGKFGVLVRIEPLTPVQRSCSVGAR